LNTSFASRNHSIQLWWLEEGSLSSSFSPRIHSTVPVHRHPDTTIPLSKMDANLTANLLSSKFRPLNEETSISQGSSSDSQIPKCINFKSASNHVEAQDLATRLLFEIGIKLKTKPVTVAVAAKVYHQFYEATSNDCYDPYVRGSLASSTFLFT